MYSGPGKAESEEPHVGLGEESEVGRGTEAGSVVDGVLGGRGLILRAGSGEQVVNFSVRSDGQAGHESRLDAYHDWRAGYWENFYALGDLQGQLAHIIRRIQRQGPAHEDSQRACDWLRRIGQLWQEGEQLLKGNDHH